MAYLHAGTIYNYFEQPCGGNPIRGIDTPGFEDVQFVPAIYRHTFAEASKLARHEEVNGRIANIRELVAYFEADNRHWFMIKSEPQEDDYTLTHTAAICTAEQGRYTLSFDDSISARIPPGTALSRSDPAIIQAITRAARAGRRATLPDQRPLSLVADELQHPVVVAAFGDMAPLYEAFFRRDLDYHPRSLEVLCMTLDELQSAGVTPDTAYIAHVGLEATHRNCKLHAASIRNKGDILFVRPKYGFGKLQE